MQEIFLGDGCLVIIPTEIDLVNISKSELKDAALRLACTIINTHAMVRPFRNMFIVVYIPIPCEPMFSPWLRFLYSSDCNRYLLFLDMTFWYHSLYLFRPRT